MAYEFLPNNLANGAAQIVIPLLATYQKFALLPAPVTEDDMRVAMELDQVIPAGQPRTYTDESWLAFMTQMSAIGFNDAPLTIAELTIINTIRQVVEPPKSLRCCATPGTIPSQGDGLTDLKGFVQLGFPNWKHEIRLIQDKSLTCDIKKVQVALTPLGGAPAPVDPLGIFLYFNRCDIETSSSFFSKLDVEFVGNPSGFSYEIFYSFLDVNGGFVTPTYQAVYNLTL